MLGAPLVHDIIDQELHGIGQHESRKLINDHQDEAQREELSPWAHQLPDLWPDSFESL
jgi:hypothetical protein